MMPKGREQVLRSTWGVPDNRPYARALARKKIRTYLPLVHPQLLSCELGHHQQTQTKNLQPIMARGFSPYATFGTWKKVALAKNRIRQIDRSNEMNMT